MGLLFGDEVVLVDGRAVEPFVSLHSKPGADDVHSTELPELSVAVTSNSTPSLYSHSSETVAVTISPLKETRISSHLSLSSADTILAVVEKPEQLSVAENSTMYVRGESSLTTGEMEQQIPG